MIHGFYVEIEPIIMRYRNKGIHVYYLCGGRGIGKTYGAIDLARRVGLGKVLLSDTPEDNKVLFFRRTGVEASAIARNERSFFKKYNRTEGTQITTEYVAKDNIGMFYDDADKTKFLGYITGLSVFANLRGIDFTDVALVVYDECVPESLGKTPLKDEGYLFLNAIETINRNRKLEGKPEIYVVLLSNPIDLGNPFLAQMDITSVLNHMILSNMQAHTIMARSFHIRRYVDHPVSEQKKESFLYQFASSTGFNERALSGDFVDNDLEYIKNPNLSEYTPLLSLEQVCVYQHKKTGRYHLSTSMSPCKNQFKASERDIVKKMFGFRYKLIVLDRGVTYDSYATKVIFESMIGYKPLIG